MIPTEHRNVRAGQRFGNYRLLQLLGRGGFAEVYLGEHIYLNTRAALKVLPTPLDEQEARAFQREAHMLASLIHQHIVRVLDFGIQGETPFLVLDYAPGGTLRKRHPRGERLLLATVVNYVSQVASALQYAHSQHLIHRDVKPENILLGRDGELLLADFGIAVLTQSVRSVQTQTIVGTPTYMAPEQLQGHPCQASDQYALGVLAYEWLCGNPPFSGMPEAIAAQHFFVAPPPLKSKIPSLSSNVEQIILQALAKDPASRFPSVAEFADALSAVLAASSGKSVGNAPDSGPSPASPLSSQPGLSQVQTATQGVAAIPRVGTDNRHGAQNPFASIVSNKRQEVPSSSLSLFGQSSAPRPMASHKTLWTLMCGGGVGYFSSGALLVLYKQASQGFTNEMTFLIGGGAVLLSLCCLLLTGWLTRNLHGRWADGWIAGSSAGLMQQIAAGILSHIALVGIALPASFPLLLLLWGVLGGLLGLLGARRRMH